MTSRFLVQTTLLLLLGQALLGGIGWFLVQAAPWAGLPVTAFYLWFVLRTAAVFRDEAKKSIRRGEALSLSRLALAAALSAQVPGLLLLPFWAPGWVTSLLQGALLPLPSTAGMLWPAALAAERWLWLAAPLQVALFVWGATRGERDTGKPAPALAPVRPAAGDWAPARRLSDIQRRGRRVK